MPTFYHKTIPKTVQAYSLELCPEPTSDWVLEKPDYTQKKEMIEAEKLSLDIKTEVIKDAN